MIDREERGKRVEGEKNQVWTMYCAPSTSDNIKQFCLIHLSHPPWALWLGRAPKREPSNKVCTIFYTLFILTLSKK